MALEEKTFDFQNTGKDLEQDIKDEDYVPDSDFDDDFENYEDEYDDSESDNEDVEMPMVTDKVLLIISVTMI